MNNDEARFILAAYRPGGQDATDPLFAEPLSQAQRDPDLKAWFKSQLAFDSAVSAKLRELQPPPGLRDLILAGVRVSQRERTSRRRWYWFAAAAMFVICLSVLAAVVRSAAVRPELAELNRFALRDTAFDGMEHIASLPGMRDLEARLAETHFRNDTALDFDLVRLRANGCRTVRVAGREVFEICFGRDHEFHVYIARRDDFATLRSREPRFVADGRLSAATWVDSRFAYSLVTTAGSSALRGRF